MLRISIYTENNIRSVHHILILVGIGPYRGSVKNFSGGTPLVPQAPNPLPRGLEGIRARFGRLVLIPGSWHLGPHLLHTDCDLIFLA